MTRRAQAQLVFTLALAAVGWGALVAATALAPPTLSGHGVAGVLAFVVVILATRAMAFPIGPGAVLSLDSGFYVAAAVTLGASAAGLIVALALTADAAVRRRRAGAGTIDRRDLAYVAYFGGLSGALVTGVARLVALAAPASPADGELANGARVVAIGVLLLVVHNAVQGARSALGGRSPRAFAREQAVPGILAELSLLPVAAVAAQLYADGRLLGFTALAATHLLLNLVFNRLARANAAARARVRELELLDRTARALYEMATVDGLTGLFVRRYFDARLDEELERARRYRAPFAVVMLDLDDFKRLNDEHGHLVGDRVLREIAAVVRSEVRGLDTAARYGGEELAIVLPGTDLAAALATGERLRRAIGAHRVAIDDGRALAITASIGIAAVTADGAAGVTEADAVLRRADEALYRAKRAGKDRVEAWWPDVIAARAGLASPRTVTQSAR